MFSRRRYIIWDTLEGVVWRGPWTKKECLQWFAQTRRVLPKPENVDKMFKLRKL